MDAERIHRAVSDDGTTIAGHVRGQGPPLVLVHGVLADSDLDWGPSLPFLTDRFTQHAWPGVERRQRRPLPRTPRGGRHHLR